MGVGERKRQREREKVCVSAFADGWVWDCIYVGGLPLRSNFEHRNGREREEK